MCQRSGWLAALICSGLLLAVEGGEPQIFRVATYNLEGYVDAATSGRPAKSAEAKAQIRQVIRAIRPDVLALQEIGSRAALLELRDSLKAEGLDFPHWELVPGSDTNIHVAVLSRFAFLASRPHTNLSFLLGGRRFHVGRGFGDVDIRINDHYQFTVLTAHLKSRRPVSQGDEAELRLEEAKLLRDIIEARLSSAPDCNLVVLGDLNDTQDSPSLKLILGRGKGRLVDTRPPERGPDATPEFGVPAEPRLVTWTHYYAKQDTYSRIDYILLSPEMARRYRPAASYVLDTPRWGVASDHRPVVAEFEARDN